jgi:hypothetical protein
MFCPQCGISQSEDLKFCKTCGTNLYAVRKVVTSSKTGEKFDWNTWLTEITLAQNKQKKNNEIKAGVITSCVGIGVMIFLYFLMQGIILSGQNPPKDAIILGRVWLAGLIPFFAGVGLLINGWLVNGRQDESPKAQIQTKKTARELASVIKDNLSLSSDNWHESTPPQPSVVENTTRKLRDSSQSQ